MGTASPVVPPPILPSLPPSQERSPQVFAGSRFESLVLGPPQSLVRARSATFSLSLAFHSLLVLAVLLVPLLVEQVLPTPENVLRAFFVAPIEMAPPPPPPPPPAVGARVVRRAPAAPRPVEPSRFVAPIEVPAEIRPEETLDVGGVEGGVVGGVEGGVPGGVVGGIVGGLPPETPPPPRVVRVGGKIVAPRIIHRVDPIYPQLATMARVTGIVVLEALVGFDGRVKEVKVLRGVPLLDESALTAVRQWRYQPLLLNGQPTEFILTVTVVFNLEGRG